MRPQLLTLSLSLFVAACGSSEAPGESDDTILSAYLADHPEIQSNHEHWHEDTDRGTADYGQAFLQFHRNMIGQYDAWRVEQGFGPVPAWDPTKPIPGVAHHKGRLTDDPGSADPLCRTPEWLKIDGDGARNPDFGAGRLIEFTSADQLGRAIDSLTAPNWHARVHATVGGDLASLHNFPLDPAFWRFHKFIDGIWSEWQSATAATSP